MVLNFVTKNNIMLNNKIVGSLLDVEDSETQSATSSDQVSNSATESDGIANPGKL